MSVDFLVLPSPSSAYGELRVSSRYTPALRARDYKDPIWAIAIYEK